MSDITLGQLDPNALPLDAFELQGTAGDESRLINLKAPWMFGLASSYAGWFSKAAYKAGAVVYNPADKLTYRAIVDNTNIEPDFSDALVEGVTWEWVGGSISGYVSGRGWWTKFADGTLIQWGSLSNASPVSYADGVYAKLIDITMPIPFFTGEYAVTASAAPGTTSYSWVYTPLSLNASVARCYAWSNYNYGSTSVAIYWMSIGRWK